MAARRVKERVIDGRPCFLHGDRWFYADSPVIHQPTPEEIIANPTERHPRYRLRVFDLRWPWRASIKEVLRDARMSGNARHDEADRVTYLDAVANIQQDPPTAYDRIRYLNLLAEREATAKRLRA